MKNKFKELVPINNIEKFISDLKVKFKGQHESKKDAQVLFHYTSAQALKNIIEGKEFWITKSEFLNDKEEIKYTYKIISKIIEEFMSDNPTDEEWEFKKIIEKYIDDNKLFTDSYILSFSTNKDSNLLWSNYSNNDGYNIGFSYPNIENILVDNLKDVSAVVISNVISYDECEQKRLLTEEIINMYKVYKYCIDNNKLDNMLEYTTQIRINIFLLSLFFKANCFKQEEEFRIVVVIAEDNNKQGQCRLLNGVFIPFMKLPICNEKYCPIKLITIGPKNNLDIAKDGLKYFLKSNDFNLDEVEIRKSEIPYRY